MKNCYRSRSCFLFVLIWVCPFTMLAQTYDQADTAKVWTYLALSDKHYMEDRLDSAEHYCLKAGTICRALDYKRGFAEFASYYIPVLNRKGKYQEGHDLAAESLEVSKSLGDNSLLAMAYNNLGNQSQYLGDLRASATNYLNALIFSEGVDKPQRRQFYSNNLASVFIQLEEKSKSFYYASKSYKLALETRDTVGMASSLINLALSEVLNEKYSDALRHLDQVLLFGRALKDDSYILDALINKADVYAKQKNFNEALSLYEKSSVILKRYPVPDYELYVYWGLAQNHSNVGNFSQAQRFLERSIKVASDLQALQELNKLYLLGSEINEKMGNLAAALYFRKSYEVLNDSMKSVETQANIHRLEIEYQTAQKEKALADQQLVIARSKLEIEKKDKSILLWSTIAITLLSAVVIIMIAYRNRQRRNAEKIQLMQKQNELQVLNALIEGEEKERSRLARELHDGVGGILSASRMHLSLIQEEDRDGSLLQDFRNIGMMLDQASQEIRNIAHNLYPDLLRMHNLDVAVGNFCQRVRSSGLNLDYYWLGTMPELSVSLKLVIYRSVQELVNNVIKHSKAGHVLVQLSHHDDILNVTVEDNGVGFSREKAGGIGLRSLEDKVVKLNGRLTIESSPGKGTTVQIEFDLSAMKEGATKDRIAVHA